MVAQKGKPAISRFGISRRSFHPARDRFLGNVKAEHEKLTMNPRCFPGRIRGYHFEDQIANILRDPESATPWAPRFGQEAPVQFESARCH